MALINKFFISFAFSSKNLSFDEFKNNSILLDLTLQERARKLIS